ncbi:hypothetical protein THMIRHAS_19880 [Thiosulfatimonas sediminis]|uniref:HIT domain-containing protein n=1 Tax=Thiosulfatimonas sediminis TaxID=2675054 RepID=A0A6F8PWW5_9GAMM|nr:hypothetical protein [Thiosulfatimonas sediminis]BBP46615.1 hypothetical protein THMIRHAS_19880 [Thiosulfatimonas sediminis]
MDQVVTDHSPENLSTLFPGTQMVAELPFFSILAKETRVPWLIFIPKYPLENINSTLLLYGQIHRLIEALREMNGMGHYNLAKIGNKNEWLHMHLVFRSEHDEAWPDPVWCREPLEVNPGAAKGLSKMVKTALQQTSASAM